LPRGIWLVGWIFSSEFAVERDLDIFPLGYRGEDLASAMIKEEDKQGEICQLLSSTRD